MSAIVRFIGDLEGALVGRDRVGLRDLLGGLLEEDVSPEVLAFVVDLMGSSSCEVIVEVNGREVAVLRPELGDEVVAGVKPGPCTVRLTTGLVLWEEVLTALDLVWEETAIDNGIVELAASIDDDPPVRPSRTTSITNGELELSVIPGLGSGSIRIRRVR